MRLIEEAKAAHRRVDWALDEMSESLTGSLQEVLDCLAAEDDAIDLNIIREQVQDILDQVKR